MGTQDFDRFEGYTEHIGDTMTTLCKESRKRHGCDVCKDQDCPTTHFDGYGGECIWICNLCLPRLLKWTRKERA